jgi:hypothetical protein
MFIPRISTKPPSGIGVIWNSVPVFFDRRVMMPGPNPMLNRSIRIPHQRATT